MTAELIFSISACIIGVIAIIMIISLKNNSKNSDLQSQINKIDAKTDTLSNSMLNSFSSVKNDIHSVNESLNTKINDMTKQNYETQNKILETAKNSLSDIAKENREQNEKLRAVLETSIEKINISNEKKLDEMRAVVDEKLTSTLTERLNSSFQTVSEQLGKVYRSLGEMQTLSQSVTSLNKVFNNVKSRGTWAEYQLENILDQTIPNMYVKNYHPSKSNAVVEFAVKIPSTDGNNKITYLPIDSKFPTEDYIRLCDAQNNADAENILKYRKALEDKVISQAKDVSKYITVPETTPFAILYLATEGLYAEIISSKNGIIEKLQNDYCVTIAGPTTITALLNSLAMGFKTIAVNEKASEIREVLGAVKTQYDTFNDTLAKIKKKIGETDTQIDEALKRNNIIRKKLKSVDEINTDNANMLLNSED